MWHLIIREEKKKIEKNTIHLLDSAEYDWTEVLQFNWPRLLYTWQGQKR